MDNESHSSPETSRLSPDRYSKFGIKGFFSNMKIRSKIIVLGMMICTFFIVSTSVVTLMTARNLTQHSLQANQNFGDSVVTVAESALVGQAQYFLQGIAGQQSQNINSTLDEIRLKVLLLSYVVEDLFNNPEYSPVRRTIIARDESPIDGEFRGTYSLPAGTSRTPEIELEIDLLSNLVSVIPALAQDPIIADVLIVMESGVFYSYTAELLLPPYFDPRTSSWYTAAISNPDRVIFTEVTEVTQGGNYVKISAAKTISDNNDNLLGVISIGIKMDSLRDLVSNTRITEGGHSFIFDSTGRYIIHPLQGQECFELYPLETERGLDVPFAQAYINMMAGEEGFDFDIVDGSPYFLVYSPISVTGWSIGVLVPEIEILSSLIYFAAEANKLVYESYRTIAAMTGSTFIIFAVIFIISVLMVVLFSAMLTRTISTPIQKLAVEVSKIGKGEFEYRIPVESSDEIGTLAKNFNDMANSLQEYTQNILRLSHIKSELEVEAYTDALTSIFNRRHFIKIASRLADDLSARNENCFVVLFDIDHFKSVNDTYGHAAGDEVLKNVARVASENIRAYDILARYGGEEFILLLSDTYHQDAEKVVERVRVGIYELVSEYDGTSISVSASFGIAQVSPVNDLHSAIKLSDEALYDAKRQGRNRICWNRHNVEEYPKT